MHSSAIAAVELVLQPAMMAKRVPPMPRVRQNSSRLPRQGSHRHARRYASAVRCLASQAAHRAPRD